MNKVKNGFCLESFILVNKFHNIILISGTIHLQGMSDFNFIAMRHFNDEIIKKNLELLRQSSRPPDNEIAFGRQRFKKRPESAKVQLPSFTFNLIVI